jgi:hypothetical protein
MQTLFDAPARAAILGRIANLKPTSARQWGKMDSAQMLTHCSLALDVANGELVRKQMLLGKLLSGFVRKGLLGEEPFTKNSPTDPAFVVADARDFAAEKARLERSIERFRERGASEAAKATHSFFGKLSGEEWGVLMWKHLDHHLRQFGA